ncbi:cytochrome P450 [Coniophora puteana RWD-64-598 SS2]|uniref:Cytochrome P450 n=1 Tax=Coniophora puteana (strain RWD-64-598) TaxID=741705 RepID=A0A5M3MZ48_CONPW|nr:cytochrome P450 [Coniophora puteana RWD-64-598 SS2]EIW84420.1 cytochrome P450 [Coniophora puteana RWD-64-598 SS2]
MPLLFVSIIPLGLIIWTISTCAAAKLRNKRSLPLPPGPDQLPFLGAALQVDANTPWLTYAEWAANYGDIVSCRFFGTQVVILNSEKVANDLLERCSRIYSDRAEVSTVAMTGWDFDFGFDRYGNEWRLHRRLFQQAFREQKVADYRSTQRAAAHRLVINIDRNPAENLWDLILLCASSSILSTVYGYEVDSIDDPLFTINDKTLQTGFPLLNGESSIIIDTFPFIKYLPTWLPGTSIVRDAQIAKHWAQLFVNFPYNFTMEKMKSNTEFSCALSETIRNSEENGQAIPVYNLKKFAATAFIGGAETAGTSSVLQTLIVALLQNPAVQKRAHAELWAVVGNNRLPTFEDRPSLPYIDALIREVTRWNPAAPLGLPHVSTEDDIYEGYFIPQGSIMVANTWAMSRNPSRYPDPETFRPERFLTKDGELNNDDVRFTFGWGRRICPGRYSAFAAIWIAAASLIATYAFERAKDEHGIEIEPTPQWTTGLARKPKPVPLRVIPRFDQSKLEQMVKDVNDN